MHLMFRITRNTYQPEGRQAKSDIHRTDHEEASGKEEFQWQLGIKALERPIRQKRGSSPKGAGAFSVHFCAYKSEPGVRGWSPRWQAPAPGVEPPNRINPPGGPPK